MQHPFALVAVVLSALVAAPAAPAFAQDRGTDISAAKKKKKGEQDIYLRAGPQPGFVRHPWMDPSFGPDGRPYRNPYPPNVCSVDEGYGRFSPCTFRD